jgi:hypothetical protein
MTTNLQIVGSYNQVGSDLIPENSEQGFRLVITTRRTTTETKPISFIIAKPIKGHISPFQSPYEYISSLYPTRQLDTYKIEYEGYRYILKAKGDQVKIEPDKRSPIIKNRKRLPLNNNRKLLRSS